jgi:ankyrin repeat protein
MHVVNRVCKMMIAAAWIAAVTIVAGQHVKFHKACEKDNVEYVKKYLMESPAVLNERGPVGGQTCLMRASLYGSVKVVSYLLTYHRDDVDVTIGESNGGYTPMHGAAYQGRFDVVKLLLLHGLSATDLHEGDGFAPFHRAAYGRELRHTETQHVFLEAGVPYDLKAADGSMAEEITQSATSFHLIQAWKDKQRGKQEL